MKVLIYKMKRKKILKKKIIIGKKIEEKKEPSIIH